MASSYRDRPDKQIDPFNAPDPIMPGGEQTMDPGEMHGGGLERFSRSRKSDAKRQFSSHNYQAPREHADAYEAPSTDGTPGTVAAERDRHAAAEAKRAAKNAKRAAKAAAKRTQGNERRSSRRGCLTVAILLVIAFSMLGSCSSILSELFYSGDFSFSNSDSYSSDTYTYTSGLTSEEAYALEDAVEGAAMDQFALDMDALLADEDNAMIQRLAAQFSESFSLYCNTSVENAGLDATAVARWALNATHCEATDANMWADSYDDLFFTGSVYFDAFVPDVDDVAYELSMYVYDHFADSYRTGMVFDETQRAELAEALTQAEENALAETETRDYFMQEYQGTSDATGTTIKLAHDEDDWESNIQSMFHLW